MGIIVNDLKQQLIDSQQQIDSLITSNRKLHEQIAALEAEAVTLKTSNRYMAEIHDTQFVAHEEQIAALKAENKKLRHFLLVIKNSLFDTIDLTSEALKNG